MSNPIPPATASASNPSRKPANPKPNLVQQALGRIRALLANQGSKSLFFARLYTCVTSNFARETFAVLHGISKYRRNCIQPKLTNSLLRRNIHRLEKGLIMRPRRDLFALDYIGETVACYETCAKAGDADINRPELQWAHNVLATYFGCVIQHPIVDGARARFEAIAAPAQIAQHSLSPYRRQLETPLAISYDDLHSLALRRRSVRWFLNKPVSRDLIDRALVIAGLSPSACNRQPFEFRVFDEPALVQEISRIPAGTGGYSHNLPVVVVVVGQLSSFAKEHDRHLIYTDASLAIMSLLFALEVQGLSSCCINWPDIAKSEKKMAALLGLSPDERPVMLVALGYPDPEGMVPYSAKKPLSLLRSYNRTRAETSSKTAAVCDQIEASRN